MRKVAPCWAIAAALSAPFSGSAQAAMGLGDVSPLVQAAQMAPVEKVEFVAGGHRYCWYDKGWNGPGFYWRGYASRSGIGWGGGYGWNGWANAAAGTVCDGIASGSGGNAGGIPQATYGSKSSSSPDDPGDGNHLTNFQKPRLHHGEKDQRADYHPGKDKRTELPAAASNPARAPGADAHAFGGATPSIGGVGPHIPEGLLLGGAHFLGH